MSVLSFFTNIWDTLKEADLRPIREQALRGVNIAIVGKKSSGRHILADQMRRDPSRPTLASDTPLLITDLENSQQAAGAELIILLLDSRNTDTVQEQAAVIDWHNKGKTVLVFINQFEEEKPGSEIAVSPFGGKVRRRVVWGSALDARFLVKDFAPAVIELLPGNLLALGRYFPLFRVPIAHFLINDACFTNAAYSFSTGLAEIIPMLGLPLMLTDSIILTKNQLFLVYKLGLALGYSTRWQDYAGEFGGILGTGFLWRQLARSLVGLIPVVGIIPKTGVAYAGTYVVGNAVLQWYLTGRHLSRAQVQALYRQALERSKATTRLLVSKAPHPHLRLRAPRLRRRKPRQLAPPAQQHVCPSCEKISAIDASFCQYCGTPFPS